ncbi:uncharacterized protein HGUI_03200 [Hanseniaspora guilliermondii]|uniref:Ureidoglycolate hydrolase n=1 Tax=Hanseniaspora guilliermondii TaxID=56406 RepID=A0A1L0B3D8_9ASCO|nr:uncharacterized protein HGUI_03200 [Hanseniaspora guilliermondii]
MFQSKETYKAVKATPENFAKYGHVIHTNNIPKSTSSIVQANQGTAIKQEYMGTLKEGFPSNVEKRLNIHIFNCLPRATVADSQYNIFHCKVMEKHPYSSQMFMPNTNNYEECCYLVIVALDDGEVEAFIFSSDQGVVYNQGVWHSPMCNISKELVSFVVLITETSEPDKAEWNCVEVISDFEIKF